MAYEVLTDGINIIVPILIIIYIIICTNIMKEIRSSKP